MSKTTKQIADELGVSKQRVYRFIKANHINEAHQENGVMYYDEAAETAIIQAFRENSTSDEAHQNHINEAVNEAVIDVLKQQLDTFREQLTVKDKQIEQLQSELAAERQHSREEVEQLTAALTAAQALHAADKQQQLILMEKNRSGFLQRFIEFFKRGNGQN